MNIFPWQRHVARCDMTATPATAIQFGSHIPFFFWYVTEMLNSFIPYFSTTVVYIYITYMRLL